jgi:4-carboxymuconolactone decarboxylase
MVRTFAPTLIDRTEKFLFSDDWERPGLSKRDRGLITVAAPMAITRGEQLRGAVISDWRTSFVPAPCRAAD